jgi:hypothetical protein
MATTAKPIHVEGDVPRKRKKVDTTTTQALLAMTENGLSRKDAGRVLGLSKQQVDKALDDTRLEMAARASEYADIHFAAAKVAAEKGRAEPAQWALERLGVVQPEQTAAPAVAAGPVIKIGIMLPGLPGQMPQVIKVEDGHVEEVPGVSGADPRSSGD